MWWVVAMVWSDYSDNRLRIQCPCQANNPTGQQQLWAQGSTSISRYVLRTLDCGEPGKPRESLRFHEGQIWCNLGGAQRTTASSHCPRSIRDPLSLSASKDFLCTKPFSMIFVYLANLAVFKFSISKVSLIFSFFFVKTSPQVTPLEEETSGHSDFRDILRLRGREAKTVQCPELGQGPRNNVKTNFLNVYLTFSCNLETMIHIRQIIMIMFLETGSCRFWWISNSRGYLYPPHSIFT